MTENVYLTEEHWAVMRSYFASKGLLYEPTDTQGWTSALQSAFDQVCYQDDRSELARTQPLKLVQTPPTLLALFKEGDADSTQPVDPVEPTTLTDSSAAVVVDAVGAVDTNSDADFDTDKDQTSNDSGKVDQTAMTETDSDEWVEDIGASANSGETRTGKPTI